LQVRALASGCDGDLDVAIELTQLAGSYCNQLLAISNKLWLSEMLLDRFTRHETERDLDRAFELTQPLLDNKIGHVRFEAKYISGLLWIEKYRVSGSYEYSKLALEALWKTIKNLGTACPSAESRIWMALSFLCLESGQIADNITARVLAFHAANNAETINRRIAVDWGSPITLVPVWNRLAVLHSRRTHMALSMLI
jgi:hypothetical protein